MRIKRLLAWLCLTAMLMTGCGKQEQAADPEQISVVVIVKAMDSLHWLSVKDGLQKAANDYNVQMTVLWPEAESDSRAQIAMLKDAIATRPDAIALAPNDSEQAQQYLDEISENGIALYYLDEEAGEGDTHPFVGSDNFHSGEMAAEVLGQKLQDGAKVAVIGGSMKQVAHYKRAHGFQSHIEENTDLSFLTIKQVPDCTMNGGKQAMKEILAEDPEVQGVFCASAMMVMGALEQCRSMGREDILLVGMDTQSDALSAVKSGSILAMVSQNGYAIGYNTIKMIAKQAEGKEIKQINYVENELITAENVDVFLKRYVEGVQ